MAKPKTKTGKFIFRWKDCGIEVEPSVGNSRAEVWAWAKKWLRGATETDDKSVTENGEVIPYTEK